MSVRCRDCRHWRRGEEGDGYRGPDLGGCDSPKLVKGYGNDPVPLDGAVVEDDEGWAILTGPDFGCVNGEAR